MRKIIAFVFCLGMVFLPVVGGANSEEQNKTDNKIDSNVVYVDYYKTGTTETEKQSSQIMRVFSVEDNELRVRLISQQKFIYDKWIREVLEDLTLYCDTSESAKCKIKGTIYRCSHEEGNKDCSYEGQDVKFFNKYPLDSVMERLKLDNHFTNVCAFIVNKTELTEEQKEELVSSTPSPFKWRGTIKNVEQEMFIPKTTTFQKNCTTPQTAELSQNVKLLSSVLVENLQTARDRDNINANDSTNVAGKILNFFGAIIHAGILVGKIIINPSQGIGSTLEYFRDGSNSAIGNFINDLSNSKDNNKNNDAENTQIENISPSQ
ncbi:hypothetical protein A45J_2521 [hot springs metagenome]|uniref:Uncharacterized protein n=1 Tax=hot springs metagenome TaxID=433727 RepID=A0A5J4L7N9_9ZZZZ